MIDALPAAVYTALVERVGLWWDGEHTWSGRASNLAIEGRAGGCFCETWPAGSVRHMTVVWAERAKALRMTGGLRPLQELAVAGSLTVLLNEAGGRTCLEWTYAVGGSAAGGLEALAKPVDAVLEHQIQRLERFIESGRPD